MKRLVWLLCGELSMALVVKGDEFGGYDTCSGQKCWVFELGLQRWRWTGVNKFESYSEARSAVWTMD